MQFLANENIPKSLIGLLRLDGLDVASVQETMRGASDVSVLSRARSEHRILLTQDKDFGELAARRGLPPECGVVLFRLSGSDPASVTKRMLEAIRSRNDWAGRFSVVTEDRIRVRTLRQVDAGTP